MKAFQSLLVAAAASSLWISIATAQPPDVHLVWERPVGSLCPSRAVLEADVEEVMGRRIFTAATDARVTVRGAIQERADAVRVRMEARSSEGTTLGVRELSAPAGECASLRAPIVLVLTLFVERDEGSEQSGDTIQIRVGIGASATVASTPLPRTTMTAGPALSIELGSILRLQLDAAYWVPVSIETRRGVGAKLEAFSLALRTCARFVGDDTFGVRLCLGVEAGPLIASPLRLEGPERQVRLLGHGLLELRAETQLGGFARLDVATGPLLSFSRPWFSYVREDGVTMRVYRPELGAILFQLTFIILGS